MLDSQIASLVSCRIHPIVVVPPLDAVYSRAVISTLRSSGPARKYDLLRASRGDRRRSSPRRDYRADSSSHGRFRARYAVRGSGEDEEPEQCRSSREVRREFSDAAPSEEELRDTAVIACSFANLETKGDWRRGDAGDGARGGEWRTVPKSLVVVVVVYVVEKAGRASRQPIPAG